MNQINTSLDKLAKLESNPMTWGYVLCSEHFRQEPPLFHAQIISAAMQYDKLAVVAPRNHAKSTVLGFLYTMYCICLNRNHYITIFSSTKEKAANHYGSIKMELEDNNLIHTIYGKPKFEKSTNTELVIKFPNGHRIKLESLGQEQMESFRGAKFGAYRPDLIIFDDVEFQQLVDSPDRRQKLKRDFDESVIPAGSEEGCQYIAIGTILHFDALIAKLVSDKEYLDWYKMKFITSVEEPLWAEYFTSERLKGIRDNTPIVYAKEYQNNPVAGKMMTFNKNDFRYYSDHNHEYTLYDTNNNPCGRYEYSNCIPAIACDLAYSERKTADYSVILSLLLDPDGNYLVYNYIAERGLRPERLAEILFSKVDHLKTLTGTRPPVGFEKAMVERMSKDFLKKEMRRRNDYFIIKPLDWKGADKINRIEIGLEHLYANNIIYHRHGMGELEDQLCQFPHAAHDDIPDALQGAVQLLKYPKNRKTKSTTTSDDPGFDFVRGWLPDVAKNNKRSSVGTFLFGRNGGGRESIPAKRSFMGGGG